MEQDVEKARELLMLGGEDKLPGAIELLEKQRLPGTTDLHS